MTLILIIVVLAVLCGGGYWGHRSGWYGRTGYNGGVTGQTGVTGGIAPTQQSPMGEYGQPSQTGIVGGIAGQPSNPLNPNPLNRV